MKRCKTCGEAKPLDEFHRNGLTQDRRASSCKTCVSEYNRAYREQNSERVAEYSRTYRAAHREHARVTAKEWFQRNRERAYANSRAYRARHPESHAANNREQASVRRASMSEVVRDPGVSIEALRSRDGDFCCYCGAELDFTPAVGRRFKPNGAAVEHITPISKGGGHVFENVTLACRHCNTSKGGRTLLWEWVAPKSTPAMAPAA